MELLAREAPARVEELAAWGCPFDRTDDGRINQRYFGAQSFRRTCFVGYVTGEAIPETLVDRARQLEIPFRENVFVTRILADRPATGPQSVTGALAVDLANGEPLQYRTSTIVLAAGGCTSVYRRTSSRDHENTGDAVALAYDAGAELRDMELIQFHPTGMVDPPEMRGRLVTEAVRGEGGRLFNARGERFMERYAPEQMELAARDVVARANHQEIHAGRGTEHGGVLLDISHQNPGRASSATGTVKSACGFGPSRCRPSRRRSGAPSMSTMLWTITIWNERVSVLKARISRTSWRTFFTTSTLYVRTFPRNRR